MFLPNKERRVDIFLLSIERCVADGAGCCVESLKLAYLHAPHNLDALINAAYLYVVTFFTLFVGGGDEKERVNRVPQRQLGSINMVSPAALHFLLLSSGSGGIGSGSGSTPWKLGGHLVRP